jgi:DNA-binding NarL/FixJ family response regulator
LIRPRVLLADDHSAFLQGTTALLKPQFEIVGTVADGAALVSEALRLHPDVIVADIAMPGLNGIAAARRLRLFDSSARIVFLTIHSEEQFVEACRAEGALGYVVKAHMKSHLIPAIQAALTGAAYISPLVPK